MSAGVFTLTEANEKAVENTWESVDNVWIFPDGGGPEFKFVDGTVTPAPPATSVGLETHHGIVTSAYGIIRPPSSDPNFGQKIVSKRGRVAIASSEKVYLYDLSDNIIPSATGLPTLKLELTIDPAANSTIQDIALNSSKIFVGVSTAVYRYDLNGTNRLIIPGSVSAIDASETHIVVGRDSSTKSAVITTVNGTSPVTLTPSLSGSTNTYGYAVGISTNRVVVGDHASSGTFINGSSGTNTAGGAAYLYDLSGTEIAKLDRKNEVINPNNDRFGYSIAINDPKKILFVGSPNEYGTNEIPGLTGRGAIFSFNLTTGELFGKYSRQDSINQDARIGAAIAVNEETTDKVLYYTAGGDYPDPLTGDSSLYSRKIINEHLSLSNTSEWQPASAYTSQEWKQRWGFIMKATGTKLISNDNDSTFSASSKPTKYIYTHNHDGTGEVKWTSSHSPGNGSDLFAESFDTDGTKIVVGARAATVNSIAESGRAYIYNMNGTGEVSLQPNGTQPATGWNQFGWSVAVGPIKGSNGARRIIVGAAGDGFNNNGQIYIFDDSGTELSRYESSIQEQRGFGRVIEIQPIEDGGNLIIGGNYGWFLFDPETMTVIKTTVFRNPTLNNPLVGVYPYNGYFTAKNGYIVIGYPRFNYGNYPQLSSGVEDVGRVDVFDKDGNLKYELWPEYTATSTAAGLQFGHRVLIMKNTLYVGTRQYYSSDVGYNDTMGNTDRGKVLAYDIETGNFLYRLQSPDFNSNRVIRQNEGFGTGLTSANDNKLFIGNAGNSASDPLGTFTKNTAFVFTSTGGPIFQEDNSNRYFRQSNNQFARSIGVSTSSTSLTQQLDTPYDNGGMVFASDGITSDAVRFYGRESASPNDEGIFSDIYHYRQPIV
jgi:hypothetical protein